MNEHPSQKALESFLRGALEPAEQRRVLEHLLRGCGLCSSGIAPLAELALHPHRTPPVAGLEAEEMYDAAIERAFAAVRLRPACLAHEEARQAEADGLPDGARRPRRFLDQDEYPPGVRKIDLAREPNLAGIAVHNRLLFLAETGRFSEALSLLIEQRDLLGKTGASKLLGVEGRVYAGMGHLDIAEDFLRQAKVGLLEAGDPAHAGLAALDLAALLLQQGRTAEGRAHAEQALAIYQDLKIGHEARRALNLLGDALRSELATPSLVQRVVGFLRDVERRPWLQFNPAFE